jgi:hypothetical protein
MQRMRTSTRDGLRCQRAAMVVRAATECHPMPAPSAAVAMSSRRNVVRLAGALVVVCAQDT